MADTSHLERMGRELKCPICLSLLNSAVSLTCNHVFCNSCIEKSMKAASNCPVCKVPFRRREVRPAPHMDNLVSVYKSMEVASGVNIFVTQNADSTKISDDQTGVNNCKAKEAVQPQNNQSRQKGSRCALTTNKGTVGSNSIKPSCPTKKRVQVPQNPNLETQMNPEKLVGGSGEIERKNHEKHPISQKDTSCAFKNVEPVFSPFFWLRAEEDLEKLSQQTDDNQSLYTPPDAPCFSDIKDSDDKDTCKKSPEGRHCISSTGAEFIDSEMFDWTQRPCSPELCSSPPAIQEVQKKAEVTLAETTTGSKQPSKNRKCLNKKRMDESSEAKTGKRMSKNNVSTATESRKRKRTTKNYEIQEVQKKAEVTLAETTMGLKQPPKYSKGLNKERMGETSEAKTGNRMSKNNANTVTESRKRKRAKKSMGKGTVPHIESDKATHQGAKESNKENPLTLRGNPKEDQKVCSEANLQEERVPSLFQGTESLADVNETTLVHASPSVNIQKSSERSRSSERSGKNSSKTKKALVQPKKPDGKATTKFETSKIHKNTEHPNEVLDSPERELSNKLSKNIGKLSGSLKKVKFSVEDNRDGISLTAKVDGATKGQTEEIHGSTNQNGIKVIARKDREVNYVGGRALVKCNTSPSTIHCAFCQSSEESEASGNIVHYVNGKLVEVNHNARTDAIHVHRNCAEWAPNVYFEDDNVVNLETELSRSRRITCCCCGVKGAALGCYERSCRRSFHVSCAKLTPECRWDLENFVMLCPIHVSCPLPNEMPQSQCKQKKNSAVKRKHVVLKMKSVDDCMQDSSLQWKSQKKIKHLVLCCSALTAAEKDIVTEFEKLSVATILKNWDPSVTHVIASTDENRACRRTLKFLKGVLEGKWILSVQWIKASMEAGELVEEQDYEISVDVHGITDGPKHGRLRHLNKQPKLFEGCTFYFMSDFEPSYKGYLHDLVITGGGKVLNRKPVAEDKAKASNRSPAATTYIIYSVELSDQPHSSLNGSPILKHRRARAEALANSTGAFVATNSWILNSISGYRLQEIGE